uniref:Cytoplasmic protein n=1 Tax=Angiostrongylus cantonensis TaxID=6313 RepID=A0A0K0DG11_ANGCA
MSAYEQLTPMDGSLPPPLDPKHPLPPPPPDLTPSKNSPLGQGTRNEQGNDYEALGNPTPDEFVPPPDPSKPTPQKAGKADKRQV